MIISEAVCGRFFFSPDFGGFVFNMGQRSGLLWGTGEGSPQMDRPGSPSRRGHGACRAGAQAMNQSHPIWPCSGQAGGCPWASGSRAPPWGMGPREGPGQQHRDLSPPGRTAAISPAPALTTLAKREGKQSSWVSGVFENGNEMLLFFVLAALDFERSG